MKRTILLAGFALITACGETSGRSGRTGTGGSGGAAPPPQSVDDTCRDWCANEPQGASCHQGPFESVQPCYESCLAAYQQEVGRECGDEWIAIKDCQVELACEDLFGDCDSQQLEICQASADAQQYCETTCPSLPLAECLDDRAACQESAAAQLYCETACPNVELVECLKTGCNTSPEPGTRGAEAILAERCGIGGCHDDSSQAQGLNLVSPGVENRVVNVNATGIGCTSRIFVVPGDPEDSYLLNKLLNAPGICGTQMPQLGSLSASEIQVLRQWIVDLGSSSGATPNEG